jgi:tetratricopeptide (TPR) repeat protein
MRHRTTGQVGLILFLTAFCPVLLADKSGQNSVKAMLKDAKRLEKSGQLVEARKEYAQSQAFYPTKEAEKGIERVNSKLNDQVRKDLAQAAKLYAAGQFHDAAGTLEGELALETSTAIIQRDLALCAFRQGNSAKALELLGQAIAGTPDPKAREKLLELQGVMMTGETVPSLSKGNAQLLADFNRATFKLGAEATLDDPDPGSDPQQPGDPSDPQPQPQAKAARTKPCTALESLRSDLAGRASGVFDLANCAETSSRTEEAGKLLDRYLELAPAALDRGDVESRRGEIQALLALEGPKGIEVRKLFASASRAIQEREYDHALADLLKANALEPDFTLAQWKLGVLYEAMGNVGEARKYFSAYQSASRDPGDPHPVELHLTSLAPRRAKYDSEVRAAAEVLQDLFLRALNLYFNEGKKFRPLRAEVKTNKGKNQKKVNKEVGGFAVPFGYAQEQLALAAGHLQLALSLFPLGAEANELMALVYLQANDGQSAVRCFDVVASQGIPVAFYAECRGHKLDHAAKCELSASGARLIFLSSYDKRGRPTLPASPAGKDGFGDLFVAPGDKRDGHCDELTLTTADIAHVETKNGLVRIKFGGQSGQEITLAPIFLPSYTPIEGPPARRFANTYTRLFMRYSGLEDSKLGAEGLTGMEKVRLGFKITQIAMNMATAAAFGPGGALLAFQEAQNAMTLARDLNQTMSSLRVGFAGWERLVNEQQNLLAGVPFKMIPTAPPDLNFALR